MWFSLFLRYSRSVVNLTSRRVRNFSINFMAIFLRRGNVLLEVGFLGGRRTVDTYVCVLSAEAGRGQRAKWQFLHIYVGGLAQRYSRGVMLRLATQYRRRRHRG